MRRWLFPNQLFHMLIVPSGSQLLVFYGANIGSNDFVVDGMKFAEWNLLICFKEKPCFLRVGSRKRRVRIC